MGGEETGVPGENHCLRQANLQTFPNKNCHDWYLKLSNERLFDPEVLNYKRKFSWYKCTLFAVNENRKKNN